MNSARWIRRYDGEGRFLNNIGDQHRKGGFHIPNGAVDFAVDLGDDLLADLAIAVEGVEVVELVGGETVNFGNDLGRPLHHLADQFGVDAMIAVYQFELCAEGSHRFQLLVGERVRTDDTYRVPLDRAHERQRTAG